jgi:hypothetical protein
MPSLAHHPCHCNLIWYCLLPKKVVGHYDRPKKRLYWSGLAYQTVQTIHKWATNRESHTNLSNPMLESLASFARAACACLRFVRRFLALISRWTGVARFLACFLRGGLLRDAGFSSGEGSTCMWSGNSSAILDQRARPPPLTYHALYDSAEKLNKDKNIRAH